MSQPSDEAPVLVEQRDRVLLITINRPQAKNAVNAAVSRGLSDAMDRLDDDPGLSVVVLTGPGGSFCAGMDLRAFARGENVIVEGRGMGFTERPPVKPLIAAVEGYALAGGTELALATDLIVAASNSAFGIPEVKRGLVAGGGGLLHLPRASRTQSRWSGRCRVHLLPGQRRRAGRSRARRGGAGRRRHQAAAAQAGPV